MSSTLKFRSLDGQPAYGQPLPHSPLSYANCWQRVRIEFEYESRNFLEHLHPAEECDLIVCWSHNWPDFPVEVLELQNLLGTAKIPA